MLETLAVCFFDQHLPLILVVAVDEPVEAVVLEPSTDTARAQTALAALVERVIRIQ